MIMNAEQHPSFALIGASGFVAPRHLRAIRDIGGNLLAALDPHDSAGVLDAFFPDAAFFTEFERFDRYIDKLRRQGNGPDYISICSPNYLHDAHVRFALRNHAHVVCEKPLVLNPWNLEILAELEKEYQRKIYTILQLRLHPAVRAWKEKWESTKNINHKTEVTLTYITSRGKWYFASWKGDDSKSGGVATNIGIHFFDMLLWIFGRVESSKVYQRSHDRASGYLELEHARVKWFLSISEDCLPQTTKESGTKSYRSLQSNGEEIHFSDGFTDLHTVSYSNILHGEGYGISEARPSIELVHQVRTQALSDLDEHAHPLTQIPQSVHPFLL